MNINGVEYKFYEVIDEEYGLAVATDKGKVLMEHIKSEHATDGVDIYEVPYSYAKRKFELNQHLVNYVWLQGMEFDSLVEEIVNDKDDNGLFILFDSLDSEDK